MRKLIITIDGPAGAGKTTASRILAERLNYTYVDTGALYRGIAYEAKLRNIRHEDPADLEKLCRAVDLRLVFAGQGLRLLSSERDITDCIRTPEITMLASAISAKPVVRECLFDLQRRLGAEGGAVFEGRDMGTVVFPKADVKFFLEASVRTRALRRFGELAGKSSQSLEEVEADIMRRDQNDSTRAVAPLKPAEDAIVIDSTLLSITEVVDRMLMEIHGKHGR
ncbi:MAG: (d)CMP kinase [Thermodesulfobacteriota bacterium]